MMNDLVIRAGELDDLEAVTEIYNYYIRETAITFDVNAFSPVERRDWFEQFGEKGPYRLVVAAMDGRVVGYAGSTRFRPKAAYITSVETTVYLDPGSMGRGIGTKLYEALFDSLRGEDLHRAYAGITQPNPASIALHLRFGFRSIGTYREVGRKLGQYWDVEWFEKSLG
jgi:phosphinothricin acetyltransferase